MTDFPSGGDSKALTDWLKSKNIKDIFTQPDYWTADTVIGLSDEDLKAECSQSSMDERKARVLRGLLNEARRYLGIGRDAASGSGTNSSVAASTRDVHPNANLSTSASALKSTHKLSFLSLPYGPGCYYGGSPLIELVLTDVAEVSQEIVQIIEPELPYSYAHHSYKIPSNPDDDENCSENLMKFQELVKKHIRDDNKNAIFMSTSINNAQSFFEPYLTICDIIGDFSMMVYSGGDDEYYQSSSPSVGVVGGVSRAVNAGDNVMETIAQVVAMSGDMAMTQWQRGLGRYNEIIVLFVLTYSECIQFGAVYLLPESYPCATLLTRPLSLLLPTDRDIVSRWVVATAKHCDRSVLRMERTATAATLSVKPKESMCFLKTEGLFLKPIVAEKPEDASYTTTQLMTAFQMLYDSGKDCRKYIEFPLGMVGMTEKEQKDARAAVLRNLLPKFKGDGYNYLLDGWPIIVYRRMDRDGWKNCEEYIMELRENEVAFVATVEKILEAVLTAGLVHLDARLANFMFRLVDGTASPQCSSCYSANDCCSSVARRPGATDAIPAVSPQGSSNFSSDTTTSFLGARGARGSETVTSAIPAVEPKKKQLEVKLIDWDTCARVGYSLPYSIKDAYRRDDRYPQGQLKASSAFHEHFLKVIQSDLATARAERIEAETEAETAEKEEARAEVLMVARNMDTEIAEKEVELKKCAKEVVKAAAKAAKKTRKAEETQATEEEPAAAAAVVAGALTLTATRPTPKKCKRTTTTDDKAEIIDYEAEAEEVAMEASRNTDAGKAGAVKAMKRAKKAVEEQGVEKERVVVANDALTLMSLSKKLKSTNKGEADSRPRHIRFE